MSALIAVASRAVAVNSGTVLDLWGVLRAGCHGLAHRA